MEYYDTHQEKRGGEGRGGGGLFKVTFVSPPQECEKVQVKKKVSYLHQVKKGFFNNLHNSKSSTWKNNFLPPQVWKSPRWKKSFYPTPTPPNKCENPSGENSFFTPPQVWKGSGEKWVFTTPTSVKRLRWKMGFYYPHRCEKAQVKNGFFTTPTSVESPRWKTVVLLLPPQVWKAAGEKYVFLLFFNPKSCVKSSRWKTFSSQNLCEKLQVGKRKRVFLIPSIVWKGPEPAQTNAPLFASSVVHSIACPASPSLLLHLLLESVPRASARPLTILWRRLRFPQISRSLNWSSETISYAGEKRG